MTSYPELPELIAAAAVGPERLLEAWQRLSERGEPSREARLDVAEQLVQMARPEDALEILSGAGEGVRVSQLRALALDKRGRTGDSDRALEILVALRARGALDGETGGMLGGRYKRRARAADDRILLGVALDVYRDTWLETGDTYPGINAASLALELEGPEESRALAADVLEAVEALPASEVDHWIYATRGEAHLLLGELDEARRWYQRAVRADHNAWQSIADMRAQARIVLELLGHPRKALDDVFALRSVAAFTGHLLDAPDRESPRFPAEMEGAVRRAIRQRLRKLDVGFGFASAARGGDLLFLEELLDRGGSARVVLPFPLEAFEPLSVGDWAPRLEGVLAHPRVRVRVLLDQPPGEDELPAAFASCNRAIRDEARRFARRLDQVPRLIALWDGRPGDGGGGTADTVDEWTRADLPVERIPLPEDGRASVPAGPREPRPRDPAALREPRPRDPAEGREGVEPEGYHRRFCLAIGIDRYPGGGWGPLANAQHDARTFAETLGSLHGFDTALRLGEEATRDHIAEAIVDDLRGRVSADDLVVLYFAGHGHTQTIAAGQRGFLVPADAEGLRQSRLIPIDSLSDWSASLDCRHLLAVFDSCFSGLAVRLSGSDRRRPDPEYGRVAITSGKANQTVLDGPPGGHSPFADAVITALTEGPPGSTSYFTAMELYSFVKRRVLERHPAQTPIYAQLKNHEGGDPWFRVPRRAG